MSKTRIILVGAGVLVAFGIGMAAGGASAADTAKPTPAPAPVSVPVPGPTVTETVPVPGPTVTETVPPPAPKAPPKPEAPTFTDGTYVVGTDIPAGTYKTAGPGSTDILDSCYWARLANLSGELEGINANDNITGPSTIELSSSDKAVEFHGGCTWAKV